MFISYEIGLKYFPEPSLVTGDLWLLWFGDESQLLISFLSQILKKRKERKKKKRDYSDCIFQQKRMMISFM